MILSAGKRRRRGNNLYGFTLIELALVTLLILILMGLSTPLFRRTFQDLTIKDSAYSISKLMNYAREMAVLERKNFTVSFDFQKRQYRLLDVKGKFGRVFTLPDGVYLYGAKTEVIFYPDGHCDEVSINITDKTFRGYTLTQKGFGSLVEMKEIQDAKQ